MREAKFYAYDPPAADRLLQETGMSMPIKVRFSVINGAVGGNDVLDALLITPELGTS
jgi:hypothetical protein